MQLSPVTTQVRTTPDPVATRLEELGRVPIVRFDYRGIPGNVVVPPMAKVASAVPAWTDQVAQEANELGWDGFWERHPAGAGRLTRLDATSYEDAVRAARELALTTRTHHAPGNRQAQGVLQLADGSFHAASLGVLDEAIQGLALLRMGTYPGYWRPTATSLVPELLAVVGGASMVDLRGRFGVPVKT